MSRPLRVLPVPPGPRSTEVLADLDAALDGRGPALLPVPADDAVRARILTDALLVGPDLDDAAALVVATSGSTGVPKGAVLTAAGLEASAAGTDAVLGGPGGWLLALPAAHIAGLQVLLRSHRSGVAPEVVDVSRGFDPETLPAGVDALRTRAPRAYTSLVPGQLHKVLDSGSPAAVAALAGLDAVLVGGAATPPALLDRALDRGVPVVRTYGMSETCGGCVYDGLPLPGVRVRLDAADGSRVVLDGPQVALGYRGTGPGGLSPHPDFPIGGGYRTGDAGVLDPHGRLTVLGRLDDALTVGGLTVLPAVVEAALATHPRVVDAVVVGLPDPRLGARLAAAVTPADAPSAELAAHVRARLGEHAAPATVEAWPELPLLASGKTDRRAARERLARSAGGKIAP